MMKNEPMFVENFDVVILVNIQIVIAVFNIELEDSYSSRLLAGIVIEDYLEREGYVVKRHYMTTDDELNKYGSNVNRLVKSIRDNHFYHIVENYFPKVDTDKFNVSVNILSDKHMEIRITNEIESSS